MNNEELLSEVVSDNKDPSVGVEWMRCSPGLPDYIRKLENDNTDMKERLSVIRSFFHSPQSYSMDEFQYVADQAFGDRKYAGRYFCVHADDWRTCARYLWWMLTGQLKSLGLRKPEAPTNEATNKT
jgi:hypothetical protein